MATYAKSKARRRKRGESEAEHAKRIARLDRVKRRRQAAKNEDPALQRDEATACAELVLANQREVKSAAGIARNPTPAPSSQEKGSQWRRSLARHEERVAEIERSLRALDGVSPKLPVSSDAARPGNHKLAVPDGGEDRSGEKGGGVRSTVPPPLPPNDPPPTGPKPAIIKEKEEDKNAPPQKPSQNGDHLAPNDPRFEGEMIPEMIPPADAGRGGAAAVADPPLPEGSPVVTRLDFAAMSLLSGWLSQARASVRAPHPLSLTFGPREKDALRGALLSVAGNEYDLGAPATSGDAALREFAGRLSVGLREMGGRVWSVTRLLQACERATAALRVPGAADPDLVRRRFDRQVVGELRCGTFAILGNGRDGR